MSCLIAMYSTDMALSRPCRHSGAMQPLQRQACTVQLYHAAYKRYRIADCEYPDGGILTVAVLNCLKIG